MKKRLSSAIIPVLIMVLCSAMLVAPSFAAEMPEDALPVTVRLEGPILPEPEEVYLIKLKADDPAYPMPAGSIDGVYTVSVTGAGSTSFPAISYDRVGSYTYTLYQEPGENDKAVYDDTVYLLTVYVTNQENGTGLDTQWVLRLPQTEDKQEAEFTNFYEAVLPVTPPLIQVEKLAKESSFANAGDLIHYYFIVTNDGMVPVVKLIVNDPKLGIDNLIIDLNEDPLMPGETYTYEFSQAYVVTQADVEAGKIDNTLTVKGENEEELAYEATDDLTITREKILPHIPKTGESRTYWTGIAALMLGGAVALILINRRRNLKIQETDQE